MNSIIELLPSMATMATVAVTLFVIHLIMRRTGKSASRRRFRTQLTMFVLSAAGALLILLVLPISDTMRGQLLGLFGILFSAAIALSATTFLGNAMAGVMLKAVRNFRTGDFVRCQEHFGRISERGLFHTEIQNEDRSLTTLPNLVLVTNPVTVVRSSGTFVSATVSLGYDVPRSTVEKCLLEAAESCELKDAFVRVMSLGDFSVSYRVSGLLTEVKRLLSAQSGLHAAVLDKLHAARVEIVSPNFTNQRVWSVDTQFIARPAAEGPSDTGPDTTSPDVLAFDKAERAESLDSLRAAHERMGEEIGALKDEVKAASGAERERAERKLSSYEKRRERLEEQIARREAEQAED